MSEIIWKAQIQVRRGTTAEWLENKSVVPVAGEPCLDLDTGIVVYGDGTSTYETLLARYVSEHAHLNISGDEASVLVEDGVVKVLGFDGAEVGAQPRKKADGTLEWVKPDTTTVDGINTTVEGLVGDVETLSTDVSALQEKAHEHANKDELDLIVAGDKAKWDAMEQNAKDYADAKSAALGTRVKTLEEAGYLDEADKEELVQAIATAKSEAKSEAVQAIIGEAGIDEKYDTLKEVSDWILSDTTNSAQLVTRVSNIEADYLKAADKTELEGEIDALGAFVGDLPEDATSTTVVEYVREVVNGIDLSDYAKAGELSTLVDRVSVVEGKSHEHENKTVLDQITEEKVAAWDAGANVIEVVKMGDTELEVTDKTVTIPGATLDSLGVVKSSLAENFVKVNADFTMEVNSLNVNRLVQTEGEVLILDGGSAAI